MNTNTNTIAIPGISTSGYITSASIMIQHSDCDHILNAVILISSAKENDSNCARRILANDRSPDFVLSVYGLKPL